MRRQNRSAKANLQAKDKALDRRQAPNRLCHHDVNGGNPVNPTWGCAAPREVGSGLLTCH